MSLPRARRKTVPGGRLERDVVVRSGTGGCRLEVAGVRRDVTLRGEALPATVATAAVVAAAEELHGVGHDFNGRAVGASLLVLPLTPLEPAVDRDRAALGQVARAVLALRAPHGDVEVVGLVDPLAGVVLAARVGGDAQAADGGAARRVAQLWIAREVARQDNAVDVGGCH